MLLWCSFWLVRVGPSECGARVREGMDLISCCMSTLDDRRAVDESGGGGRGYNSAQYISQYGGDAAERYEEHEDYEGQEEHHDPYDDEEVSGFY